MSQLVTVYHLETSEPWELQDVVARQLVAEGSFGYTPPKPKVIEPAPKPAATAKGNVHRELVPLDRA